MRVSLRSRAVVAVAAVGLAFAAVVAPVAAAPAAQQVTITSPMTVNSPPEVPNDGTFTTSGPAADNGLICEGGAVVDTSYHFAGFQSSTKVQLKVDKQFTCPDGLIFIRLNVHIVFGVGETFTWVVTGGTDAYADLNGSGQGSTVGTATGVINTYTGHLVH